MVRKLLKIVSVLFIIAVIVMLTIYYALFVAVSHTGVRYETLASAKIPEAMNDVKIAYFTDLEYGFSIDEQRLRDIVDTINHNAPDVVIFGGDLFDDAAAASEEDRAIVIELFKNIDAPLGKFAVLGERDCASERPTPDLRSAKRADFEILNNRSLHIRNGTNSGIVLARRTAAGRHIGCDDATSQISDEVQHPGHPLSGPVRPGWDPVHIHLPGDRRSLPRCTDQPPAAGAVSEQ
ncbi:MAG: hypothetical protein ACLVJ6_04425 [Merdibacter sp.]